ncbi:hypothetical protein BH11ACT8_BH11ACT8_08290 [soil metagenome]
MTTEHRQDARTSGVASLAHAALLALGLDLLVSGLAFLVAGGPGLAAALIGTAVVVLVLFNGACVVDVVSRLLPAASLMVALLTYTLQMALVALLLLPLSRSTWADQHLDDTWLAIAVIAGALAWTVTQVVLATRVRIPVYDLPAGPVAATTSGATERSER